MRRREFLSVAGHICLRISDQGKQLGEINLVWEPAGVKVDIPPGNVLVLHAFRDVLEFLIREPHPEQSALEANLLRYGIAKAQ